MTFVIPQGFSAAGVYSGIKRNPMRQDVALVVSNRPAAAAGVYTKNLVYAAPVAFDRQLTPGEGFRAVVINSGNANACTGERGLHDAAEMARLAAAVCGAEPRQALVLSTGIIGEFMPMEKIAAGIQACAKELASDEAGFIAAARGMMTTDTVHKLYGLGTTVGTRTVHLAGMCKGAAMIAPNMGTMLGLILTDAPIAAADLQRMLTQVVDDTFNCISVDGHMSTNDTVLLLANGAAGGEKLAADELQQFQSALHEVCGQLAKSIPADGEGATHLICIDVKGCATVAAARQIAKSVADSPLVKTAIHGADPNWGRIVSAAGYAGAPFNPAGVNLEVNGVALYRQGAPVEFNADEVSASIKSHRETNVVLSFAEGSAAARFWTADLTAEYVRLNADYHT
ncbi:MAG TPA: bifunctional glutamate N-acetyltransferase/amino-acid acetyltransferase ArgJ [Pirellulales bacterium]|jgi:glutamate N-acetyltransferase/amino-acid N-acetyltransferase|nr:bifunctional glutamate N-acetyltransferase/amino-acid acetyltransferase ArgJ [Pirellulales bacterium]